MDRLRTVIFIDGRNFKYNLAAFKFLSDIQQGDENSEDDQRYFKLDEKHFKWREFFLGIIDKFNLATKHEHRLIRVYWYNAGRIRPFNVSEEAITEILAKYKPEYDELTREKIIFLAKAWWEKERDYFNIAKDEIYEKIQRKTDFLEFKYTGEYVVHPFKVRQLEKKADTDALLYRGTKKGEKGVDVGIAVDMIVKMPSYDVAILVSGDADFLPVICQIKDNLKNVYQFSIAQGIPPNIKYLSPWLIGTVDVFQFYDEIELLSKYFNPKSVPRKILEAIDKRINELKQ